MIQTLSSVIMSTLLFFAGCYPQQCTIKPITSFHEVDFSVIQPDTLVVFDVDETLIQPIDAITILLNKGSQEVEQFLKNMAHTYRDITDRDTLMSMIWLNVNWPLIEPDVISTINQLKERGIPVIACTAMDIIAPYGNFDSTYHWRYNHLKSLGFEGSHQNLIFNFEHNDRYPVFYKGILVTDMALKGPVIGSFLDAVQFTPQLIVMFDDNHTFLATVQDECTQRGIIFQGYLYQGAQARVQHTVWDEELATQQVEYLIKHSVWLSDEEMKKLISTLTLDISLDQQDNIFHQNCQLDALQQ